MKFQLVDAILERSEGRIVTLKQVSAAEEYLGDHFPGFPVLPGVMMLEAMVQAARTVMSDKGRPRMVLGSVKAIRYGSFVRPGESLRVDVAIDKEQPDGAVVFRGAATVLRPVGESGETAVSGRFTMRPIRKDVLQGAS
jgi:3-hydroxyacyl-[acyl-carrier-protein] dehydratase